MLTLKAVRIPADLRLPDSVKQLEVRACGQGHIIAPTGAQLGQIFFSMALWRVTISLRSELRRSKGSVKPSEPIACCTFSWIPIPALM
jgi:virulence-associated protein VagC